MRCGNIESGFINWIEPEEKSVMTLKILGNLKKLNQDIEKY